MKKPDKNVTKTNNHNSPCTHRNIIITAKNYYEIPQGWEELQEQEDVNMEDYIINCGQIGGDTIFCQDCGEYLE